jgi:hypothetical protein
MPFRSFVLVFLAAAGCDAKPTGAPTSTTNPAVATTAPLSTSTSTSATSPSSTVDSGLAAALASLSEGYHCGLDWYVAYNEARTVRLQASLLDLEYGEPEPPYDTVSATLGGVATLSIFTGSCLWTPGSSDSFQVPPCGYQKIEAAYDAVSGEAELSRDVDGRVSGSVVDVVFELRGVGDQVSMSELILLPVPEGVED